MKFLTLAIFAILLVAVLGQQLERFGPRHEVGELEKSARHFIESPITPMGRVQRSVRSEEKVSVGPHVGYMPRHASIKQ